MTSIAKREDQIEDRRPPTPAFVLTASFDSGLIIDEHLWDWKSLDQRLGELMFSCPSATLAWGYPDAKALVTVEQVEDVIVSMWVCGTCGRDAHFLDSGVTPPEVLGTLSTHDCESVTDFVRDETGGASPDYLAASLRLEALEADGRDTSLIVDEPVVEVDFWNHAEVAAL